MKKFSLTAASADDYKYIVIKIKTENVTSDGFELFYASGKMTGPVGGYSKVATFDQTNSDWQYVIYDLSQVDAWTGKINMFRFDFLTAPSGAAMVIVAVLYKRKSYLPLVAFQMRDAVEPLVVLRVTPLEVNVVTDVSYCNAPLPPSVNMSSVIDGVNPDGVVKSNFASSATA